MKVQYRYYYLRPLSPLLLKFLIKPDHRQIYNLLLQISLVGKENRAQVIYLVIALHHQACGAIWLQMGVRSLMWLSHHKVWTALFRCMDTLVPLLTEKSIYYMSNKYLPLSTSHWHLCFLHTSQVVTNYICALLLSIWDCELQHTLFCFI